jgi:SAM-dependent methyltransferase
MNRQQVPADAGHEKQSTAGSNWHHRDTCRLCQSLHVELVVPLEATLLPERYVSTPDNEEASELYPVDLYMCLDCGHVQILDVVSPDLLWSGYTYHSAQNQTTLQHFEEVVDKVVTANELSRGLVIDIGSNDGSLLRCFQRRGFKVLGIDPAEEIASAATESGIETLPSLMSLDLARSIRQARSAATVVSAFNVFAHTDDMAEMADSIREMLAPDGVFIFEVSYLLDIIDKFLLGTVFHEHLCHHSLIPLQRFLEHHGMELIHVERADVQGGSLIGTAQHQGGPRQPTPAVGELIELETRRGLDKPPAIRAFSEHLKHLQRRMNMLLDKWQAGQAAIAGFGAARSGPTLMAQFKLGNVISYIFDDHFQKVNKFTNGDRIPVVRTAELLRRQPDYVVILAWVHADKIISGNLEYLRRGGRFVLCCPEVRVIGIEEASEF